MFGSEEYFGGYNPSASNDRVLNAAQKVRDEEIARLRRMGDMRIEAEGQKLRGIAALPEKMSQGYLAGTEESRKARQADALDRQQRMAEEQDIRQKELHPLEVATRKQGLEQGELAGKRAAVAFGDETGAAEQAARHRSWLSQKRDDGSGLTNEQYELKQKQLLTEGQIKGQKTQDALARTSMAAQQEQTLSSKEAREVPKIEAQYVAALQSGDPEAVAALDKKFASDKNASPGVVQMAKTNAAGKYRNNIESQNALFIASGPGGETLANLKKVQAKAMTLSQVKGMIADSKTQNLDTTRGRELKANITALLNREEMGPEGKNAAELVNRGLFGRVVDLGGLTTTEDRLEQSLKGIEQGITTDLNHLEMQNGHVRVPVFIQNLNATKNAVELARSTPTEKPKPSLLQNPTTPPQGDLQNVNGALPPPPNPDPNLRPTSTYRGLRIQSGRP